MRIASSNFFVETKLNSNSIVKRSRELMRLFGYKESDLEVLAEEHASNRKKLTKG